MNNSLLITILIISFVTILFLLIAIQNRKNTYKKKERILDDLQTLKSCTTNSTPSERVVTIMKLDNLLSKAFQYHYGNDRSCSDNLKQSRKMFKRDNYQNLWDVHKLRNSVVHEEAEISESDIKKAYDIYNFSIRKILK
ncbi:MAG: hypothetical protein PHE21_03585 [Candidatus Dojkabacteria bacterium]|nr:hypothetical protein [Candidatus Dojkabacteria bacterium]